MDSAILRDAIDRLDLKLVNDFINSGGNVNGLLLFNNRVVQWTPLRYALGKAFDDETDIHKRDEIILRLISAGANVNALGIWSYDESPLMVAVQNEYSKRVIDAIIRAGANINYCNRNRNTALEYARRSVEIFMTLIQAGADVHIHDSRGRNLFFGISCYSCDDSNCEYQEIINVLLNRGVDIKEIDIYGNNILHRSNCQYLMRVAVNNGVPVDSINKKGRTPLMDAIICADIKKLKKFLVLNVDPNRISSDLKHVTNSYVNASAFDKTLILLVYHGADLYSHDHKTSLHEYLIRRNFHREQGCLKAIIKHLLLFYDENSLSDFFYNTKYCRWEIINSFATKCRAELNKMRRLFLKGSLKFYQLCNLKRNYKSKHFDIPYGKYRYNCEKIKKLFPIYEDLIIMRLKDYKIELFKNVLKKRLDRIIVTLVSENETSAGEQLNYYCLNNIASYLDKKQFYNLFLASIHD